MSSENRAINRLLVVGYDGATWDLAGKWAQGRQAAGAGAPDAAGRLRAATLGDADPVACGLGVLGHGRPTGQTRHLRLRGAEPGRLSSATRHRARHEGAHLLASRKPGGQRVAAINVPVTYPPAEVNGIMVTGLGTPEQRPFTYLPKCSARNCGRKHIPRKPDRVLRARTKRPISRRLRDDRPAGRSRAGAVPPGGV